MRNYSKERLNSLYGCKEKSLPWYAKTIDIPKDGQKVLEEYSGIAPEDVKKHVLAVRDDAWEVVAFPCVGEFGFLELKLSLSPSYARCVARLVRDPSAMFLDLGCCVGQDVRKIVLDGVPGSQVIGVEREQPFIDIGYRLFRDRDRLGARMLCRDVFDERDALLDEFSGRASCIHAGQFLHVFTRDEQKALLKCILGMLVDDGTGMLLGSVVGHDDGVVAGALSKKTSFMHNVETWRVMWKEIETESGIRVKLWDHAWHLTPDERYGSWLPKDRHMIMFEVTKLKQPSFLPFVKAKL